MRPWSSPAEIRQPRWLPDGWTCSRPARSMVSLSSAPPKMEQPRRERRNCKRLRIPRRSPYDNRSGFTTAAALANLSANAATITASIWDPTGVVLGTQTLQLPANGHTSFLLPSQFAVTSGLQGTVQFQSSAGNLAGVGLQASPQGTFTSVPLSSPESVQFSDLGFNPGFIRLSGMILQREVELLAHTATITARQRHRGDKETSSSPDASPPGPQTRAPHSR